LTELEIADRASASRWSHVRMSAIRILMLGFTHDQVAAISVVSRRTLSRWVQRFNERGIDGLIDGPKTGRPPKITAEQSKEYEELIERPQRVDVTHWTAKKFHGYLTEKLQRDIGYRTVVRWLHEKRFRLKVPRSWPNGQDDLKRDAFVKKLVSYLSDREIDIWYGDESGIEGDPRPRRRWAKRGEKIRHPYQGTHIRMNVTGMVGPRTGEFYSMIFSHSDTDSFQFFLDQANQDLVLERPRNLLIVDNASWHRAKSLNWGKFEPIFLPPYSPDLNPIERLWLLMKGEWFSDFFAKSKEELIDRLCLALNWIVDRKVQNQETCSIKTEL
jgi:transposase